MGLAMSYVLGAQNIKKAPYQRRFELELLAAKFLFGTVGCQVHKHKPYQSDGQPDGPEQSKPYDLQNFPGAVPI
jgi:hypothetical protein